MEYVILACWVLRQKAAADAALAESAAAAAAATAGRSQEVREAGPALSAPPPPSPWSPFIHILPAFIPSPVVLPDHVLEAFDAPDLTAAVSGGTGGDD